MNRNRKKHARKVRACLKLAARAVALKNQKLADAAVRAWHALGAPTRFYAAMNEAALAAAFR